MQPEGGGRLHLAVRHGLDPGANDLRDEGGGEGHETERERGQFGNDLNSALQVEAAEPRDIDRERRAGDRGGDCREPEKQRRRNEPDGGPGARALLAPPRPASKRERGDQGEGGSGEERHRSRKHHRSRQEQPAIVEKDEAAETHRLSRARQSLQDRIVPEKQQQQERRIAQDVRIEEGGPGQEPVRRQAGDADSEAEQRRERNADRGDEKGVEQADPEGLSVGGKTGIGNQVQVDFEAGRLIPEAEAHGNATGLHVDIGVIDAAGDQEADRRDQQRLICNPPHPRIVNARFVHLAARSDQSSSEPMLANGRPPRNP